MLFTKEQKEHEHISNEDPLLLLEPAACVFLLQSGVAQSAQQESSLRLFQGASQVTGESELVLSWGRQPNSTRGLGSLCSLLSVCSSSITATHPLPLLTPTRTLPVQVSAS